MAGNAFCREPRHSIPTVDLGWLTGNPDVRANNFCADVPIAGPAFISPTGAGGVVVTIVGNVPFNFFE
jgi:hypothetical protein